LLVRAGASEGCLADRDGDEIDLPWRVWIGVVADRGG
jgi:hypothetical protein